MKLFTKSIDDQLFAQYPKGGDLENQKVVAKIFNPYGRGTWYLINSDPNDSDYLWAIVDLFEIEVGSVSRMDLETIKVPPFRLGLERDTSFTPINAQELFDGLLQGKHYAKGGSVADSNKEMLLNQAEGFEHHAEEFESAVEKADEIPAWVVAKSQRASTDLSDITHYLDGENEQKRERKEGEEYAKGGEFGVDKHRVYFSSFAEVMDAINDIANENGYDVVDIFPDLSYGGVGYGQTKRAKVELEWNGKDKMGKSKKREKNTLNVQIYRMDSGNYELNSYFSYAYGGYMAKGGMLVTSIKDIPNFKERLDEGKITYRGLGMGKLYDDFYKLAGQSGTRIKVDGKEYFITDEEFDTFSRGADGKMRIRFDAPQRKGYADGGYMANGGIISGEFKEARYAKGKIAYHPPKSEDKYKNREMRLAEAKGVNGKWSHREKAYIMSKGQAEKLKKYLLEGKDASSMTGNIYEREDEMANGGYMAKGGEVVTPNKPIEKMTKLELMKFVEKIDPTKHFYPKTTISGRNQAKNIYTQYLERNKDKMASGGIPNIDSFSDDYHKLNMQFLKIFSEYGFINAEDWGHNHYINEEGDILIWSPKSNIMGSGWMIVRLSKTYPFEMSSEISKIASKIQKEHPDFKINYQSESYKRWVIRVYLKSYTINDLIKLFNEFNFKKGTIKGNLSFTPYYADGGYMAKGGVIGNYELMPYIKGVNDTYNPKYQAKEYFEGTKDDAIEKANSMLSAEIGMVQVSIVNPKATNVLNRTKKIATVVYKDGGYMEKGGSVDNWVLYDNDTDEIISFHKSAKSAKSAANKILDAPIPKHKEVGFMLESNWNKEKEAIKKAQELRKHNKMAMGGVTFKQKVKAVKSSLLERKKVSPKVQKDYGKTYSPKEAEESAKRIVGAMTAAERLKAKRKSKK